MMHPSLTCRYSCFFFPCIHRPLSPARVSLERKNVSSQRLLGGMYSHNSKLWEIIMIKKQRLQELCDHKEMRVDGHIFISIQAYHLLHAIEYTLRQQSCCSRWATIKRVVSTHRYSTIQLPTVAGSVINIRKPGIPEGIHQEIYNKLGVDYTRLPTKKIFAWNKTKGMSLMPVPGNAMIAGDLFKMAEVRLTFLSSHTPPFAINDHVWRRLTYPDWERDCKEETSFVFEFTGKPEFPRRVKHRPGKNAGLINLVVL